MKVKAKYEVSETSKTDTWDVEDLGYSPEEWSELSEDAKNKVLIDAIVEQPYWCVASYEEI